MFEDSISYHRLPRQSDKKNISVRGNFPLLIFNISRIQKIVDWESSTFVYWEYLGVKSESKETLTPQSHDRASRYIWYYLSLSHIFTLETYIWTIQPSHAKFYSVQYLLKKLELEWCWFGCCSGRCEPSLKFTVWTPLGLMFPSSETKKFISF